MKLAAVLSARIQQRRARWLAKNRCLPAAGGEHAVSAWEPATLRAILHVGVLSAAH
jgi:hypothetical protein